MLAGLLVITGALYLKGYWKAEEPVEEMGYTIAADSETAPDVVTRDVEIGIDTPDSIDIDKELPPSSLKSASASAAPSINEKEQQRLNELAERALDNFNKGNYETAVNLFAELSREDRRAFLGLGLSYYKLGDYRSAADFLERSIGAEGVDEFKVRKSLAFTYYKLDDLDMSLKNAEVALNMRDDEQTRTLKAKLLREKPVQDDFIGNQTLHFKVLFDGYENSELSTMVLGTLEEAYNSIGVQMNHFPRDPVTVILYSNKEFYNVTQTPDWSGGMFDGKIRIPLMGIEKQDPAILRRTLYHEYAHALIYSMTHACPMWINEGLAVYLSGEKRTPVGQQIPLRSLEMSFPKSSTESSLAYDVSYNAVSYLINTYGIYTFKVFLSEMSKGTDINGAFKTAFLISYSDFTDTWGK